MIASAFVQNGAKVYIVSRKEAQLKTVSAPASVCRSKFTVFTRLVKS